MMRKNYSFRCVFFVLILSAFSLIVFSLKDSVYSTTDTSGIALENNPYGIAINPNTDIAVIANEKSDSVSIVDINTQTVLSTISVGKRPRGVAIDRGLNLAIIGNSHDNTVSIIDLNTNKVTSTVPVGKQPEGIAVNQATHRAYVTNHKDNTVSVIDLFSRENLGIIPVGKEPKDIAIDPILNLALVVNEKGSEQGDVEDTGKDTGSKKDEDNERKNYTVSVIDLSTYKVTGTVPVGQKPQAIDINPETHLAAVANEKDNSITVINLLNWQTTTIPVGKHPIAVAINQLDNRALVICDEDRTLLLIDLNTNTIIKNYVINKKTRGIAVNNFTNIAAVVDDKTDSLILIQLPNPVPQITSINPPMVYRGSAGESITIQGNKFIKTSTVYLGGQLLGTTFIDNHNLRVNIPKELLVKAGTAPIAVINPSPDGGTSNIATLQINNPVPSISMIDPNKAMAGTSGLTLSVYGIGFFDDTTVYINGIQRPFTLVSQTKIQTELTAGDLEIGAYLEVTASNHLPGGGLSNKATFTVLNPIPTLSSINPASVTAESLDFKLTLTGSNFVKTSIVSFNNQQYSAAYISSTQLEATIPSSAIQTAGQYPISISNPLPGGGVSSAINLEVRGVSNIPITPPEDSSTPLPASPETKGAHSLWVGEEKKVIEVSTEDGKHLLEIPAKHLEDIAVDNYRGVVWVGTRKEIIQYTLKGQELFRYPLNIKTKDKDDDKYSDCAKGKDKDCDEDNGERIVHISLDPSDGSLWIGAKEEAIKLSYDGQELFRIKDVGHVQDVSVDISNSTCWVGLKHKAIKYSSDGSQLLDFSIEDGNKIQALAADPFNNSLWIGTKKGLIKIDKNGSEQFNIDEPHDIQDLKVNAVDASLWLVTKKEVFKYSSEGKRIFRNVPCPDKGDEKDDEDKDKDKDLHNKSSSDDHGDDDHDDKECEGNLITLTLDPYDGSAWIAWRKAILKLSIAGEYLRWLKGFKQIEAIDIGLPKLTIKITEPLNGAIVDTPSITVKGIVSDSSASVTVNGVIATVTGNTFEAHGVQLSLGVNTITATAANIANISASDTIYVTYQPSLTIKINFPENGAILLTSPINVTGTVSDANARVTVNGIDAVVYENTFTAAGIGLTLGENIITATATDALGRKASDTIKVFYETWIDVTITFPSNGVVLSVSPINVTGIVNDPNAYVEVNGIQARVAQDGSFTASGVRLYEGLNQITAQAVNKLGQTDSDTVNVIYQPPSVPLSITILSPVNGSIIETPNITVKGAVADPNATVLVNDTLVQVDDGFFTANVYACGGPIVAALNTFDIDSWSCTITVTAYSKDGQRVISSITYTYVPSQNPLTITITSPAHNNIFTYSPIEVKGKINDALSNISPTVVTVNGVAANVQGDAFTAAIPLNDGINYITANAKNMVGSDAYDTIRIIYEPSTKPLSVTITAPINNSIVNYSSRVSGNISDSTAIVEINGIRAAQDFRGFVLDSLPLSVGENIITARAVRPNGETATSTIRVTYDPSYPSPPPPLLSELPQYAQAYVAVSGLTLPNYGIEVFVNGALYEAHGPIVADSTGFFNSFALLTVEGLNRVSARAVDPFGNRSALSNERVVIRDTIRPTISNGIFFIDELGLAVSRVMISGYTDPFAEVEIIIDQDPDYRYNITSNAQGKFSIITHLSAGKHRVQITAKDRAGNTDKYDKIHLVHNLYGDIPISPMIDPISNPINETNITVEGNAYAGFYVELYRNNELMGGMVADKRGRFRFEGVNLIQGRNILKVRQIEQRFDIDWFSPSRLVRSAESHEVIVDVISGILIRPEVKIDFPVNGAVTNAEFLPLRGIINNPDAILRCNGYYEKYGLVTSMNGRFISSQKIPLLPGRNILWIEAALIDGTRGVDKIEVYSKRDAAVPSVNITNPVAGGEVYDRHITVSGTTDNIVQRVIVNEIEALSDNGSFISDAVDASGAYTSNPDYSGLGYSMITAWAMDGNGRIGHHNINVRYKYMPTPQLYITSPVDGEILSASPITVRGEVYDATEVRINGVLARMSGNTFNMDIELTEGQNVITVMAKNAGKAVVQTVTVTYQPSSPIVLQSIAITPSDSRISLGEILQLRAIGTYSNGMQLDLTANAVWTSNNTAIATVNRGLVTGKNLGLATITATYGGMSAGAHVYVGFAELIEIRPYLIGDIGLGLFFIEPPSMIIGEKDSLPGFPQFRALGYYSDGSRQYISPFWTNSNPSVATLSASSIYSGFRTVTALSKGTTEITATVGSLSATRTLTVKPRGVYVFITSPVDGSTINRPDVTVSGAIGNPSGKETGVVVNGIVATVSGQWFIANNVPLSEGSNTITATATDTAGNTTSTSITVNANTAGNYITLTSNIESGISPLEVTLKIDGTFSINESSISVTGPAQPEFLYTSANEYSVKMTVEGTYYFEASVTGPDGNVYQDTIAITVLSKTELDTLLKGKWEGMKGALINKDTQKAANYFTSWTKERYAGIFTTLGDRLPQVAQDMQNIRMIYLRNGVAKYRIRRVEAAGEITYYIYFVKDENGVWKIQQF